MADKLSPPHVAEHPPLPGPWCDTCQQPAEWREGRGWVHAYIDGQPAPVSDHEVTARQYDHGAPSRFGDPWPEGTRVRHIGEQYTSEATATILGHEIVSGGHIEYRVLRDKPLLPDMPRETWWAATATIKVAPTVPGPRAEL
jgi:hypothetical protein